MVTDSAGKPVELANSSVVVRDLLDSLRVILEDGLKDRIICHYYYFFFSFIVFNLCSFT